MSPDSLIVTLIMVVLCQESTYITLYRAELHVLYYLVYQARPYLALSHSSRVQPVPCKRSVIRSIVDLIVMSRSAHICDRI